MTKKQVKCFSKEKKDWSQILFLPQWSSWKPESWELHNSGQVNKKRVCKVFHAVNVDLSHLLLVSIKVLLQPSLVFQLITCLLYRTSGQFLKSHHSMLPNHSLLSSPDPLWVTSFIPQRWGTWLQISDRRSSFKDGGCSWSWCVQFPFSLINTHI